MTRVYRQKIQRTARPNAQIIKTTTTTIANGYVYDHAGRRLNAKENINSQGEVVLNKLGYNEIGQLKQKQLHSTDGGSTYLQLTKYAYNERAWLKGSISSEFGMKLGYDTLSYPQYNGNISAQLWGTAGSYPNRFDYTYDRLNRLTEGSSTGIAMSEVITYDVMGNMTTLSRDGGTAHPYFYTGNRLNHVDAVTNPYSYDQNGNTTIDGRMNLTQTYTHLNQLKHANTTGLNVYYTYNALGTKLRREVLTAGSVVTDYVDGIQYTNGAIDFIRTEEGRARNSSGTYVYEYDLTDHLGNVRYSFDKNAGVLRKLQADDYYPFGLRKVATVGNNDYLYNSKELQTELGKYDYGARIYDPVIGRWNVVDPLAEKFYSVSPYNYTDNNRVNNIDPNGMETYYGQEAQDMFRQIQNNLVGGGDGPGPKKQNKPKKKESGTEAAKKVLKDNWFLRIFAGREVMNAGRALDAYDEEGWLGYINTSISNAHKEIGFDFGNGQYVNPWARTAMGFQNYTFTQTAKDGNLLLYSTKIGNDVIEFGGDFSKSKGVLTIGNFDIDGNLNNKLGFKALSDIIKAFGKSQGVEKVIIQGAKRTTGANPGKVPSPLTFNIDK
ncbi:RHS repeat-associated core domain-containing protein [Pedobacter sp. Du54]|uniref:RHS repeat domain-containing protein n=1 Tax=Pedobacter anseongensis TaxID=3133439 RepID=UPI0030A041C3